MFFMVWCVLLCVLLEVCMVRLVSECFVKVVSMWLKKGIEVLMWFVLVLLRFSLSLMVDFDVLWMWFVVCGDGVEVFMMLILLR